MRDMKVRVSTLPGFAQSSRVRRLTEAEKAQYKTDGYVKNLPVFSEDGVAELQALYRDMAKRMPDDLDVNKVNNWHKASARVFHVCRTPAILDYVEDVIGPDIMQWGCQLFVKHPGDGSVVPWHQDAQYWPLNPHRTVTVWLAVFDTDEKNGAMRLVSGSHHEGNFRHETNNAENLVLDQEVPEPLIDYERVVSMDMKAGEMSLHDDGLLHGSLPNASDRMRVGFTMRFCPPDVKCDLDVWPNFETYVARGKDRLLLNPRGQVPNGERYPVRRFQHSSEFAS